MNFSTDALLAAIRPWVEHETPTDAPTAVSALMASVAAEAREVGARVQTIPGRDGLGDHLLLRSPWGGEYTT
jgi:glutamate carboxypeptidase